MHRRDFLKTATLLAATTLPASRVTFADTGSFRPSPDSGWRTFELTTRAELAPTASGTRVWLPLPSVEEATWMKPMGNVWQGNAAKVQMHTDATYGASMLAASWEAGEAKPIIEVTSRFATRDRAVDLARPAHVAPLDKGIAQLYTRPTQWIPTDGIVKKTALEITRDAQTDLEKARAIYDWVVENTERDPKTRGCGTGDIRAMLETGNLKGKCADLNALYVGLARSVGLPARDLYGIRVSNSKFGYQCLGKSGDVSKAQHCRAEVWLSGFGWVPVDPADVRKIVLEERPGLTLKDDVAVAALKTLFGAWETNWLAFNCAHDVTLPGSSGATLCFLMYPQGENGEGRFDSLDADRFRYKITSREITA